MTSTRDGRAERATGLLRLRRDWTHLPAPRLDDVVGDLAAGFLPPLRRLAPAGLGLIGLPRWWGKRFAAPAGGPEGQPDGPRELAGINLLRPRRSAAGPLLETLPMTARIAPSLADGREAVVVSYAADAPRPWRWVRDEVRRSGDGALVAMTYVDLPGLRRLGGTPFLLERTVPADR